MFTGGDLTSGMFLMIEGRERKVYLSWKWKIASDISRNQGRLEQGNSALALSVLWVQCGASSHWFSLLRLQVVLGDRRLGGTWWTHVRLALMSLTANSPCCRCRRCLVQWTAPAATATGARLVDNFHCHWWWYLILWTALAANADGLAATESGPHSNLSFDCSAWTGQKRVTWKTSS
jgi:hypothetical protein